LGFIRTLLERLHEKKFHPSLQRNLPSSPAREQEHFHPVAKRELETKPSLPNWKPAN